MATGASLQVVHDLRVYAEANRATVRFYRDNKGLEVDAIVEAQELCGALVVIAAAGPVKSAGA